MQLFFDFDGVILDSVAIRTEGFRRVLKDFDDSDVDQLIEYHNINGGISRYAKFKWFYKEVLKKELSQGQLDKYTDEFSSIMLDELSNKSYLIQQTVDFLKRTFLTMPMHVVSGADQTELRHLCKELDVAKYFNSIYGSPTAKDINITQMLDTYEYDGEDTIMICDSINDYEAAHVNGIYFCGFNQESLRSIEGTYYIDNFDDFRPHEVLCNR
jgi:phosphoglycolate phosphatase-like HAD superfamily hydrolase